MTNTSRRQRFAMACMAGSFLPVAMGAHGLSAAPFAASVLPTDAPAVGLVCTPGTLVGSTRTFNLEARSGYVQTPDGNDILMWSYADADPPSNGHFQSPGPVLCATQGDTVVVNLANSLPESSSIVFPGQDEEVSSTGGSAGLFTTEATADTGMVSYSFLAARPGTYVYESGSDIAKQLEMGLYGALVIRPSIGDNYAYTAESQFSPGREYLLLLSEIDPDLHHAVERSRPYDINALHNRYFMINGRAFPDTIQDNGSGLLPEQPYGSLVRIQPNTAGNPEPALVRMINVGALNHPFHPHGNHTTQIAQDGRLVAPSEHFAETIGSGQTADFLLRWDDTDHWNADTNPLPQPNYRNVFFKDGNTWYSGSPYLGSKGTLPTGVTSQNICGEWYFPWHSHALNEFTNFDQGFGGMGTLLRVDPPGGCTGYASSATIVGGALRAGTFKNLGADDAAYFQVKPKTTTRPTSTNSTQTTITVASAASFPVSGSFYIRVDSEVMQVTAGQGTTTWTVVRGQLGTAAAGHAAQATVSGLATDWYSGFGGVPKGASNVTVTYKGKSCTGISGSTCAALTTNLPQQTVRICDWTVAGASGCSTSTSAGWVTLAGPPAQPQSVGSFPELNSTWIIPNPPAAFIGTGSHLGEVRLLVHSQRFTAPSPVPFSTWGNLLKIGYDAP